MLLEKTCKASQKQYFFHEIERTQFLSKGRRIVAVDLRKTLFYFYFNSFLTFVDIKTK